AYGSATAAAVKVFAEPFPPTGAKYRIADGSWPVWSADDKELTTRGATGANLGGVHVMSGSTSQPLTVGNRGGIAMTGANVGGARNTRNYDWMPDGKRFVVVAQPGGPGEPNSRQIHVVENWSEELKTRVPTK